MDPQAPSPEPIIERRHEDNAAVSWAKTCLSAALGMTLLMVIGAFAILLINPAFLDLRGIRYLGAFLVAIIVALFAAAGINVVNVLNGHQSMMVRLVGEKERYKGKLEGLRENPDTNIN